MSYLEQAMGIGNFGSALGGIAIHPQQLAAIQQEQSMNSWYPLGYQAMMARMAAQQQPLNPAACIPMNYTPPPRKKVESKAIEMVEIRPEQDVKLLKAGEGI